MPANLSLWRSVATASLLPLTLNQTPASNVGINDKPARKLLCKDVQE
jgi:hypothetical protein